MVHDAAACRVLLQLHSILYILFYTHVCCMYRGAVTLTDEGNVLTQS